MPKGQATEIFSIFGQIERAAAEFMIGEGKATKIHARDVPATVATNDAGVPVSFAIIIPHRHIREFERVIAYLRA